MKTRILLISAMIGSYTSMAQYVGINEPNPGAQLTVKASNGLNKSFLVKSFSNDTSTYIQGYSHYLNGYNSISGATLTVNNKYFLPFDQPQLMILASGERSGPNSNGSAGTVEFRNINSSSRFSFDTYLGAVAEKAFGINYYTGTSFKSILYYKENGKTGMGTYFPTGRLQVNHASALSDPTINLYDSAVAGGPVLQFMNAGGSKSWQIQAVLNHSVPNVDYLHFLNSNDILASLSNTGNFGIGITNPQQRLHLHNSSGNIYTGYTNSTTGTASSDGLIVGVNEFNQAVIINQEATRLYLGTSNISRLIISETGNVGIGIDPPVEKLDVVGNINATGNVKMTGEVNRTATGNANMIPVAYGNISPTGIINSGSGNISVSKLGTGVYQITITGENYHFQNYTTTVTPAGNSAVIITNTSSGGGNLYVYTYSLLGLGADSQFCFVVYKQ